MGNYIKKLAWGISWGIVVVSLLGFSGVTQKSNLEGLFLGYLYKFRGAQIPSPEIVLISIGDADLKALGSWQWPRSYHSVMLEILKDIGVKTIGYDILFLDHNETDPEGDAKLTETLLWMDNVVLPIVVDHSDLSNPVTTFPFAGIREAAPLTGYVNLSLTKDKKATTVDIKRGPYYYFGLQLLANYLATSPDHFSVTPSRISVHGNARSIDIPVDEKFRTCINFAGPTSIWKWYGFAEVLSSYKKLKENTKPEIPLHEFRNKIVLIGSTDTNMGDIWAQPYGLSYGVEAHANFINSALQNNFLVRLPKNTYRIISYGLIIILSAFVTLSRFRYGIFTVAATVISLFIIGYFVFCAMNVWIDTIDLSLSVVLTVVPIYGVKYIIERKDRAMLMQLFSRHVSHEIADDIWRQRQKFLDGGRPPSQKMTVSVLFSDFKGYTSMVEKIDPQMLMDWINSYVEAMAGVIDDHGGVVDDYAGDGIKANFGVPIPRQTEAEIAEEARRAVRCAMAMAHRLGRLNAVWEGRGFQPVGMRIGIATGHVVSGSLGSAQRLKYTTVGDTVNAAARLESLDLENIPMNPGSTCRILIDERTRTCLGGEFLTESIGEVVVKGKQQPILTHRVLENVPEALPAPTNYGSARASAS